jgi:hypothetical protein
LNAFLAGNDGGRLMMTLAGLLLSVEVVSVMIE